MLYNIIKYVKVQTVTVFVSRLCLCFSFSQVGPVKFSVWYNLEWQRLDVLNIYLLFFSLLWLTIVAGQSLVIVMINILKFSISPL